MLKNMIAYAEICSVYVKCEYMQIFVYAAIISTYAILKMPLYVEKYVICGFSQNM